MNQQTQNAATTRQFNAAETLAKNRDQARANARLIAAAPELLEACRLAADDIARFRPKENHTLQVLTAAIAQATGSS